MATVNGDSGCRIWNGCQALCTFTDGKFIVENSPRAGGSYVIGPEESFRFANDLIDDSAKARLTTILIRQRRQGVRFPDVTRELIEAAKNTEPMSVHERADKLLLYLANKGKILGNTYQQPYYDPEMLACTESVEKQEINFLADYLKKKEWIAARLQPMNDSFTCQVTVEGYAHIESQRSGVDSVQAFVAMWFDDSMSETYESGMVAGVTKAGYRPMRIDQKEHINKIDDEIIAEIRRSRFLVADFTQGDDGARGGVYYEAGFAAGLGLPVIYTCRKDMVEKLHFDTRQFAHIVWNDAADLQEKLRNRILAVIGEGPEQSKD